MRSTDNEFEQIEDLPPSKSELKRQHSLIQEKIEQLLELSDKQLLSLSIDEARLREIQIASAMAPSSARKRQVRFIAKLIGKDANALEQMEQLLENSERAKKQSADQHHLNEYWREKILAGDDKDIFEFSTQFPETDRQRLRQLKRDFDGSKKTDNLTSKQLGQIERKQKETSRKVFKLIAESIRASNT